MGYIMETLENLMQQTAFSNLEWTNFVMILVACFFLYLAIVWEFEPLLLLPIAFGIAAGKYLSGYYASSGRREKRRGRTSVLLLRAG